MAPTPYSPGSVASQGRHTRIHVVCSPHAHVGTTLTARLLLDFFISQSQDAVGFDTNHLDPGLAPIFPRDVEIVDLASTRGQMALFDHLIEDDNTSKVVDLWHVSYDLFFRQAKEIGFFEEARARDLKCFILLHMDPRKRFARELIALRSHCPGADVILVENQELASLPNEQAIMATATLGQQRFVVPRLDPTIQRVVSYPEVLLHRFASILVPEHLQPTQFSLRRSLLPVFDQFEIMELASELGLPVRSLLPRKRPPLV